MSFTPRLVASLLGIGILACWDLHAAPEKKEEPKAGPNQVILALDGSQYLQMKAKDPIAKFQSSDEKIVNVTEAITHPDKVVITGLATGNAQVTLVDKTGKEEKYEVIVRKELFVPIGRSQELPVSVKKPIRRARVAKEKIASATLKRDGSAVTVKGLAKGETSVVVTGQDNKAETFDVIVRSDLAKGKNAVLVAVGKSIDVQMASQRIIKEAFNSRAKYFTVDSVPGDPTVVRITGTATGVGKLIVTDVKNKTETVEVIILPEDFPDKLK